MDVDNLLPGERFDLRLKEALAGTDVFLAVIGARWLTLLEARAASGERDYVREEIAAALAARIVVIPVLMDRAPLPKAASLPEDIRELALYHKHDVVYESFGRDVQALVAAIEAHRLAREKQAAEKARLAREREKAEIEAARRTRQRAKEEAEAERRAQMRREARVKPRLQMPAQAIAIVAAIVIAASLAAFLIYGPQPAVDMPGEILAADAVAVPGQLTPLAITIRSALPYEKMLVSITGVPEGARLSAGLDIGDGNWFVAPRRLVGLTISLPARAPDIVFLEAQLLDSNVRTPLSAKGTFTIRLASPDRAPLLSGVPQPR